MFLLLAPMVSHWLGAKRQVPAAVPPPATVWVVAVEPPFLALHCKLPGEKTTLSFAETEKVLEVVNVTWLP